MRTFLIGSVVLVLVALFSLLLWTRTHPAQPPATAPQTGGSFPSSSENTTPPNTSNQEIGQASTTPFTVRTIPIPLANGGTVMVKNFHLAAIPDQNDKNTSYLAGENARGVIAGTPYVIQFVTSDQSFTIGLLQEPLGSVRRQAESDLMQKLGISTQEMCGLGYVVLVPFEVNENYAGRNLGFSFCPGAVRLP